MGFGCDGGAEVVEKVYAVGGNREVGIGGVEVAIGGRVEMKPDPEAFVGESREVVCGFRGENSCSHVRDLGRQRRVLV